MRQATYRLLGLLFRYPSAELARSARLVAAELAPEGDLFRPFVFYPRWRALLEAVLGLTDGARAELEEDFLQLFVLGGSCPPYESAYVRGDGGGAPAAQVEREYAAFGVSVVDAAGELPDHVGLELEFLSLLGAEEALARRDGRASDALDCLKRELAFLEGHLGRWLPLLARRVALATATGSFYAELAAASHAFVEHDRGLVEALAEA